MKRLQDSRDKIKINDRFQKSSDKNLSIEEVAKKRYVAEEFDTKRLNWNM